MSAADGQGAVARAAAGAVSAAIERLAQDEPAQLSMLPTQFGPQTNRQRVVLEHVKHNRRGRPLEARNLATRQALDFVRKVLGDPLIERARMAMHTPASLALELGCTKLEAAEFIDRIRADLQRMFYAPLAPVDGDGQAVRPFLAMQVNGHSVTIEGGDTPWAARERVTRETQQNQAFPASSAPQSHGPQSHEEPK